MHKTFKMDTKEQIIQLADNLIREKGYNAFSFYDIAKSVGIKTASIHYHFPTKSDLGIAVIEQHIYGLNHIIEKYKEKSPTEKLEKFFSIYSYIKKENKVCLIGALATDLNTLDQKVQEKLRTFSDCLLEWVSNFLEEGREGNVFHFTSLSRAKAMMIVGNMLASVQLSRLTNDQDFETIKDTIRQELLKR